jgi:ankyrin repeat protein
MRRAGSIWIVVIVAALASLSAAGNSLPLIDAVKAGNVESVRALIKQRVDVNAASPDGTTALHWAVKSNSRELAQLLIAAGAKANAANRYGVTPLTLAATNGKRRACRGAAEGRRQSERHGR